MKIFQIRFIEGYWKNMKKQSKLYIVLFSSLVITVIAALVWVGWLRDSGNNRIRQIILISIDTCRADYLDCYGYKDKTTPNISALAAEGVLFENVVSPVPLTMPAHSSLMTSRSRYCLLFKCTNRPSGTILSMFRRLRLR